MPIQSPEKFQNLNDKTSPDLDWKFINTAIRRLKNREFETAKLVAQGLRDTEIAKKLVTTSATVQVYLNRVYQTLYIQTSDGGKPRVKLATIFSDLEKHTDRLQEFEGGSGI